ncbi:hypothetical protein NIES2101_23990 [Calothrix sp. HK-06]|nr:hypothetical protein NIES2101_23855 [Calothrix sp. HK-06]OKH47329.1 hypothetical protein NIES2101_23990 [Calothrix sp. HK-06]
MELNEILQLIGGLITLFAAIWHVAEVKHELQREIDFLSLKDKERREFVDYILNGLNEKIDHKYSRLMDEIKILKEYERENSD